MPPQYIIHRKPNHCTYSNYDDIMLIVIGAISMIFTAAALALLGSLK